MILKDHLWRADKFSKKVKAIFHTQILFCPSWSASSSSLQVVRFHAEGVYSTSSAQFGLSNTLIGEEMAYWKRMWWRIEGQR